MNRRTISAMALAFLVPGAGHVYLGRRGRALLRAAVARRAARAHALLRLRLHLALLRRHRAGVGDVPVSGPIKFIMKIAIVAGEASGDLHAAEVLRELKKLDPDLDAF